MTFYEISPTSIVGKDFLSLIYSFEEDLSAGTIVEIPVGNRQRIGVILRKAAKPDFETKSISRVLFDAPLPPSLLKLHIWLSEFYTTHPSTVWQTMLPAGLNKKRRASPVRHSGLDPESSHNHMDSGYPASRGFRNDKEIFSRDDSRTNFVFNSEQLAAIDRLAKMKSGTAILHGITGSGKTAVYKALATQAANASKSSTILVPEISLTAQLVDEFRADFDNVVLTHSAQTEAQRAAIWQAVLTAGKPIVVIGPRSALFMPVRNLGLIVIDECHEPSYKQEKAPRYNALRAAAKLADFSSAKLILGSATPLIADYYTAEKLDRPIVKMKKLARLNAQKPNTKIIDLTKRDNFTSRSKIFSAPLLKAMQDTLENKKQILLFHNRRGSASTTLCEDCGWLAICPRCFLPFTLHADKYELRCHICGQRDKPPTKCPDCGSADILHKGIGTKRIEEEIKKLFPDKTVRRFDGDTARGQAVQDVFAELKSGQTDIIIGTQTIAKGLDLPNLALVGIVQADAGLMLPDFSSSERTLDRKSVV
jgi:primosomal protein N' (replication factor Y)